MAAEHETIEEENEDLRFARTVGKAMLIGLPVAWLVITLGVWLVTGQPFGRAATAAAVASVLMGVFGGGFAGTIIAITRSEH